ncbi:hypothetical protein SZMC14600_04116 [Saccharomonospora azurea SZMC 14600]|nr:hypothetical protein SZMC14600_04116 [Saccharomonospora azurea SZMC 14600]
MLHTRLPGSVDYLGLVSQSLQQEQGTHTCECPVEPAGTCEVSSDSVDSVRECGPCGVTGEPPERSGVVRSQFRQQGPSDISGGSRHQDHE